MKVRICSKCKIEKEETEENFLWQDKKHTKVKAYCIPCDKKVHREWYINNKDKVALSSRQSMLKLREKIQRAKYKHFSENPCVDCGETDPIVLEFDHVRGNKKYMIGANVSKIYTLKSLQEEIEKCEVRCSNCHKRRTARMFNWYKYRYKMEELNALEQK